jgi:hypothetical protein
VSLQQSEDTYGERRFGSVSRLLVFCREVRRETHEVNHANDIGVEHGVRLGLVAGILSARIGCGAETILTYRRRDRFRIQVRHC